MDCLLHALPAFAYRLLAQAPLAEETGFTFAGISGEQWLIIGVTIAVFVLPIVLGGLLARALRVPDLSTRLGWILFAVLASVTVLTFYRLRLGVDLRGGTILVYEIDPTRGISADTGVDDGSGAPTNKIGSSALITSLVKRINPSGTQEIVVRPYGEDQIEIIIPAVDPKEVALIKDTISQAGILRFAIVANTRDHSRLIELARTQAELESQRQRLSKTIFDVDGTTPLGFWALVDREEPTGSTDNPPLRVDVSRSIVRNAANGRMLEIPPQVTGGDGVAQWMQSQNIENIQVLMSVDPQLDVTGEDLAFASTGYDNKGAPCVRFKLTDSGSGRFFALTQSNAPDGQHFRLLGIVLDDELLSAPSIRQAIQGDGVITGNFTTAEVESLVNILQAGQLPAALTKQPIAENQIDATLGADTIRKGLVATAGALIAVLIFMVVYYRFTGIIACIVLILNLIMTLAFMILISQPLTLPGLAGLVLTVGMSVDANVLIFERIRDEIAKGAAARMAIRNGFAKAMITIIDSNLTTLITAIVLYAIGTDQIRGFAVTLILGILFSMFTAIYVSRTLLDVAERKGFLSLSMSDAVARLRDAMTAGKGFDFVGKQKLAIAISIVLMIAGTAAIVMRGGTIFDIDFSGGSSLTFRVEKPTTTDQIRKLVGSILTTHEGVNIDYTVNNVRVENVPDDTVYKIDTSLESVDDLKERISKGFAADPSLKLVTYDVDIVPAGEKETSSYRSSAASGVRLVAFNPQDDPAANEPENTDAAEQAPAPPAEPATTEPATTEPTTSEPAAPAASATPSDTSAEPAAPDAAASAAAPSNTPASDVVSRARLTLGIQGAAGSNADINAKTLLSTIETAAEQAGVTIDMLGVELEPQGEGSQDWSPNSDLRFSEWEVGLPLEFGPADEVMGKLKETLDTAPVWISSSSVGSRVAGDMVGRAIVALLASLLTIVGYVWFRFNRVAYGIAAVAALVHDVLITVGAIAVSYWLADALGFLLVDQFKISLTVVAALLTIIGYSINDTIVIFDRIRETKGK
ncbi:MAG: protein translocase subunit SecD, partial [Planctomycetaceae bacterium]